MAIRSNRPIVEEPVADVIRCLLNTHLQTRPMIILAHQSGSTVSAAGPLAHANSLHI